ncbi:GNAT family N-acetyltransferase [Streptomyces cyaneofuscatus]|uniref:GNAT family N-acetyltransferase n=1 Tax=Streptomyces cyaneofuscatus TaxID=66883 RepID=UPI0033FD1335
MTERLLAGHVSDPTALLTERHNRRWARIDSRVAPLPTLADDTGLVISHGKDATAAGRIAEYRFGENTYEALWGPLLRHVLQVRVTGQDPAAALDEVLAGLLGAPATPGDGPGAEPGTDQAAVLTWPSLDTICAAPLVRHGFAPLTSLVHRWLEGLPEAVSEASVRFALPSDLEWLTGQAEQLHLFESRLGVLPRRPALRALLAEELASALTDEHSFVLVSVADGVPVGFLHGQFPHGAWIERQVTTEPTGYLSRLFVVPEARGRSVGRALIAAAHEALRARGARSVLLHHSLHNPLAAPLWARVGYRPVLTTWTRRPGAAAERGPGTHTGEDGKE